MKNAISRPVGAEGVDVFLPDPTLASRCTRFLRRSGRWPLVTVALTASLAYGQGIIVGEDEAPTRDDTSQAYVTDRAWTPPTQAPIKGFLEFKSTADIVPKSFFEPIANDGVHTLATDARAETRYTEGFDLFNGNLRVLQYASVQGQSSGTSKVVLSAGTSTLGKRRNWFKIAVSSSAAKNSAAKTAVTATLLGETKTVSIPSDKNWVSSTLWPRATRTYDAGSWMLDLNDIAKRYIGFSPGLPDIPVKTEIIGEVPLVTVQATPHRASGGVKLHADAEIAVRLRATSRNYQISLLGLTIDFRPSVETIVISGSFGGTTDTEIQVNRSGLKNGMAVKHVSQAEASTGGGALRVSGRIHGRIYIPLWGEEEVDHDFNEKLFSIPITNLAEKILLNHGGKILFK